MSQLEVSEKIFLENPNQIYAISSLDEIKRGTIRETFFTCMLSQNHKISLPKNGDFLIDNAYLFEVGGKKKDFSQIKNFPNSYVAADDIETGVRKKIPLWLFGFLY